MQMQLKKLSQSLTSAFSERLFVQYKQIILLALIFCLIKRLTFLPQFFLEVDFQTLTKEYRYRCWSLEC